MRFRVAAIGMFSRKAVILAVAPVLFFVCLQSAFAADQRRVALVIGNSDYKSLDSLPNAVNDIREVSDVLRAAKFEVLSGENLSKIELEKILRQFLQTLNGADTSLIYYSGHGVQIGGGNYLVPVDAQLQTPYDVETQTSNVDIVLKYMKQNSTVQLVFLDACRNNPFKIADYWIADKLEQARGSRGLARVDAGHGSLIAFSTEPGSVALDGAGRVSPYTSAFVKHAVQPNIEIRQMLSEVRKDVMVETKDQQVPWENSSLVEPFYFIHKTARPLVESLQKVTIAAAAGPAALDLVTPRQDDDGALTVTLDAVPDQGQLLMDGKPLAAGATFEAGKLAVLRYDPQQAVDNFVGILGYRVSNAWNVTVPGIVAITVKRDGTQDAKRAEAEAKQRQQTLEEARTRLSAYVTKELSSARHVATIGVGPVPLDLNAGPSGPEMALRIKALPASGQLYLKGRALAVGDSLIAADAAGLSFEPAIGKAGTESTAQLTAEMNGTAVAEGSLTVAPQVDACDRLAAEPLDLQAVSEGVLPDKLGEEAVAACSQAHERWPDIGRFTYQYGRALLATRKLDQANKLFDQADSQGHVRAANQIGYMYRIGAGRTKDQATANSFYKRAADKRDPYGILSWGRVLFFALGEERDTHEGLKLMLQSADMGHTYAMNELALIFGYGKQDVPVDLKRSIAFLDAGVARDDIYAINFLGQAYLDGQGVERDTGKAKQLFELADSKGHPSAAANLGRMYRDGTGLDKDAAKAAQLLETSVWRGDAAAASDLSIMAAEAGDGVTAARFASLSAALNFRGGGEQARDLLRGIKAAAKKKALAQFKSEASVKKPPKGLDEALIAYARALYEVRNPRFDLF